MDLTKLVWSRFTVLRIWADAVYLRIPKDLQQDAGGCSCDYCRQHPNEPPMWDTLGVPLTAGTTPWTVHAPEWTQHDTFKEIEEPIWVQEEEGMTHPWEVAVYVGDASAPVRIFDRYKTERDATAYADVLRGQAARNGWNHKIVVRKTATTYQTDEHCQYCGNSWQQTRTVGTPRLDAVNCPKCRRLV